MKIVVFAVLVALTAQQQCTTGCLACASSGTTCTICDSSNMYYLTSTGCVKSTLTNCALINQAGTCVTCSSGYYLSSATTGCVVVPTTNLVTNCATYSNSISCTSCNAGFFISATGGTCTAVTTTVANCATYSANGVCATCNNGYIFSANNLLCVTAPTSANCLKFTYANCATCNTGFLLNRNLYYLQYSASSFASFTGSVILPTWTGTLVQSQVCQAVTVQNCLNYTSFNTCNICASGYYLSSGSCLANPPPYIPNCVIYSSLTACVSCTTGYYLNQNNVNTYLNNIATYNVYNLCLAVTTITNCVTYSTGIQAQTTCIKCSPTTYVSGSPTTCATRANVNIANCATYSVNSDACETCNSGFIYVANGAACLAAVPNCLTYTSTASASTPLVCSVCANTFYLSSASPPACVAGTISNCNVYASSTTCGTCANGYYPTSGGATCTAHVSIANCLTYHATTANTCAVCNTGYYNFIYDQTCIPVAAVIPNCATYSGDNCAACSSGYYLSNNACTAIPSASNCASMSANTACTACNSGYYINGNPTLATCITAFDYATPNCDSLVTQNSFTLSASSNVCVNCKTGSVPYAPLSPEAICVNPTDLTNFYGASTWTVTNCVRYGLNYASTKILVCMQCSSGNFINGYGSNMEASGARTCGTCAGFATSSVIIIDDLLGTQNICIGLTALTGAPAQANNFAAFIARIKYTGANWVDFQPVSTFSGGILQYDGTASPFFKPVIEVPSTTTTTITSTTDFFQGYASIDAPVNTPPQIVNKPSVFFYRGLLNVNLGQVTTGTSTTAWYANCAISLKLNAAGSVGTGNGQAGGAVASYWTIVATNTPVCLKCNDGYQLAFSATNPNPAASGNTAYPGCATITGCNSGSTYYGGLPSYLNAMVNCHSCSTGKVPLLAFEYNADATTPTHVILNYLVGATVATSGAAGFGFSCATAPSTVINSKTSTTPVAVANCGVYGNLNGVTASTGTTRTMAGAANFCLACNTGFFPTYSDTTATTSTTNIPFWAVISCTASTNCQTNPTNTPWNSCGSCLASTTGSNAVNYAYADHTFTNCYKSSSPNCFSLGSITGGTLTLDATNNNPCKVCNAGYFLNQDGYCDLYTIPNLATSATFVNSFYVAQTTISGFGNNAQDLLWVRYHYSLSFQASQYGASACTGTYIRAPVISTVPSLCVTSVYLTSNVAWPTSNAKFILNCIKYTPANALNPYNNAAGAPLFKCGVCANGFIPKLDLSSCVTALANCVKAQTSSPTFCAICANNFLNVNGVCSSQTVANCKSYNNGVDTPSINTLQCNACKSGFYLTTANLCAAGNVANCDVYNNNQVAGCTSCLSGFVPITLSNGNVYCYPIPSTLNCAPLGQTNSVSAPRGLSQNYVSCTSCFYTPTAPLKPVLWSAQTTTTLAQTTCMPFVSIPNCLSYDQNTGSFSISNSFACKSCATGYYLGTNGQSCVARTVNPSNCATFKADADICLTCTTGYFPNTAGTLCVAYPVGVPFCVVFIQPNKCSQCTAGYYPDSNGICVASTIIANCVIYTGNNVCGTCNTGYWLQNPTTCTQATALACLTYTSATACATCAFGYQLTTTNGVTSCLAITVANCAVLNTNTPTICAICNAGYYLASNNVCTQTTTTISNCAAYASATTCATCATSYVLSADQTSCSNAVNNYVDPNCANPFMNTVANCAQCNYGYSLTSTGCSACPLYNSGCLICDANNSTNCLICQSTYYANAPGSCAIIPIIPPDTPVTPSGAGLLTFLFGLMTLLALLFVN